MQWIFYILVFLSALKILQNKKSEGIWLYVLLPKMSSWISDLARNFFWVWQACCRLNPALASAFLFYFYRVPTFWLNKLTSISIYSKVVCLFRCVLTSCLWPLVMKYSEVNVKIVGNKASPFFRPLRVWNTVHIAALKVLHYFFFGSNVIYDLNIYIATRMQVLSTLERSC
jgi:hypothetical protein